MIINCFFIIINGINGAAAYLLLQGMKKLIAVPKKRWKQAVLWGSCWLLLAMIIYMGDWANILPTVLFFLLVIRAVCEGSIWKKATIGLMYSSTILSFNVLRDNFILTPEVRCNHPASCMIIEGLLSLFVALCLYLVIGKYAPDREYHLSDSLWKLLLLLNATPFGIVLSVVLLTTGEERIWMEMPDGFKGYNILGLLLLSLLSFIGLFQAVIVLARQQQLEEQNMLAEVNQSYYAAMEQQHFAIRRLKHDLANHLAVAVTLPEAEREVSVKSRAQKGLFCLEVTNPVAGEQKNLRLQTSKADKENHGFGLRSMKEVVERNHGAMEIRAEGERFEVFLYMPLEFCGR